MGLQRPAPAVVALALLCGCAGAPGEKENAMKTASSLGSHVRHEGRHTWIEGVPHEHFGIHWDMHVRAAHALLKFRGVDASLEQVMAWSGDALNLCHASHWQGTAYLGAPHDPMRALAEALGFEYEVLSDGYTGPLLGKPMERRRALTDAAVAKIAAEIEAGRPVIVGGTEEHCGTWTLAVGYDPAGPSFCHAGTGIDPEAPAYRWVKIRGVAPDGVQPGFGVMDGRVRGVVRPRLVGGWHANPAYLLKARSKVPSEAQRAVATLRLAVRLHEAETLRRPDWGGVEYYFGEAAYRKWAEDLASLVADRAEQRPKDAYDWYEMGNMDMQVDQVVTGRSAAAAFCEEAAAVLPQAGDHLHVAARRYREEVAIAREAFAAFIPRFNGDDEPREAYLTNPDQCRQGATAIRRMLDRERRAVAAIRQALEFTEQVEGQVRPAGLVDYALWPVVAEESSYRLAGVPVAVMQALKQAGETDVEFADVVAASGWAFGFRYRYDNWHVAALPVQHFDALPRQLGYDVQMTRCRDRDAAWEFVRRHVEAGRLVIDTVGDGGLIYGYRQHNGKREVFFDGTIDYGWRTIEQHHPMDQLAALVKRSGAKPPAQRAAGTLRNALRQARVHEAEQAACGLKGLETYLADVRDPGKDFEKSGGWFCWCTFERLNNRSNCAAWLRRAADLLGDDARAHLLAAAKHYDKAGALYEQYRQAVQDPGAGETLHERARTPQRIAVVAPILERGIAAERAAVGALREAIKHVDAGAEGDSVALERLTHRGNWVSYMGALVSCARFLDPEVSEAWVWGGSGYAFSLTVHEELCPSGPYQPVTHFDPLLPDVGFVVEKLSVESEDRTDAKIQAMFARTREAIAAGLPVMGWSLDHIDWYPICGCDAEGNYLFLGHDGKPRKYPHARLGEKAPGGYALLYIVRRSEAPDEAAAVRGALAFAAKTAKGGFSGENYTSGLGGYDVWIKALEKPKDPPGKGTAFGLAFNAACWHQCRRHAVAFLEEARKRLDDEALAPHFDEAVGHYRTVAEQLKAVTDLFPCRPGKQDQMSERFAQADRRGKAVAALTAARDAEAKGLQALAKIEKALAARDK